MCDLNWLPCLCKHTYFSVPLLALDIISKNLIKYDRLTSAFASREREVVDPTSLSCFRFFPRRDVCCARGDCSAEDDCCPRDSPEEWQVVVEWEQQRVCEFVESLHNVSNSSYKKIRFVKPTCLNQSYRRLYVLKSGQDPKRIHLS
jgi:hypothetical protein